MPSSAEKHRKLALISILTALSLAIWIIEEFIPRPMPWLKPGFSYIVILVAMDTLGIWNASLIALLRVFVGSLILGKLASPAFLLSLSGTISAMAVMSAMFPLRKRIFSCVGISVAGAFAHISTQIIVAGALFYRPDAVLWLLPPMTIWTIFAGVVVGIVAIYVLKRLRKREI